MQLPDGLAGGTDGSMHGARARQSLGRAFGSGKRPSDGAADARDPIADLLPRISAYLRKPPFTAEEREDIVCDVRAEMLAVASATDDTPARWAAALRVLRRECAARMRRRRHESPLGDCIANVPDDPEIACADEAAPPDLPSWLARALQALPFKQRYAVDYRYRWGWDYDIVAAAIESTPGAARKAACLGLKKMREFARDDPPPDQECER